MSQHLPVEPSPEWFRENIHAIAHRLKKETKASVAFCSLPPIGEDPTSAVALQSELNRRIEEYSGTIRDVALKEDVNRIPLHEEMLAQIRASPGRAFTSFRYLPFYRDAFRVVVLRKTTDEVAQLNGCRFHSDGIHLNSRGGIIAADLIQQFIDCGFPQARLRTRGQPRCSASLTLEVDLPCTHKTHFFRLFGTLLRILSSTWKRFSEPNGDSCTCS
jgi:hypothetical protein